MHIIGATSPATLFFSTANNESAISKELCFGTDYAFEEDARKCIAAGMNVHMAKPLDLDEVIEVIARLCS